MTDVVSFGSGRPPPPPGRRRLFVGAAVLAAVAATALTVAVRGGDDPPPSADPGAATASAGSPEVAGPGAAPGAVAPCRPAPTGPAPARPVALVIEGACAPGAGLDRRDPAAASGPRAVVVRRPGGSLGRGGAVVTFPVAAPEQPAAGTYVWPLAGAYARVRGDLPASQLRAIAARTTVSGGRPVVRPPAGYRVVSAGPYRAPSVHEIRYPTAKLGVQSALGNGLTFTGLTTGGGFEDAMYATSGGDVAPVGGRPGVVTSVFGGNGALAWEPAPGLIAYVGYSGTEVSDRAVAALATLAEAAVGLGAPQWSGLDVQVIEQDNSPG